MVDFEAQEVILAWYPKKSLFTFQVILTILGEDQFFVILLAKWQPAKFAFLLHLLIYLFCNEIPNLEAGEHVFLFVCKDTMYWKILKKRS